MKTTLQQRRLAIPLFCAFLFMAPAGFAADKPAHSSKANHTEARSFIADQSSEKPVRPDRTRSGKLRTMIA